MDENNNIKDQIEKERKKLNVEIDMEEDFEIIYSRSIKLDKLIEKYISERTFTSAG